MHICTFRVAWTVLFSLLLSVVAQVRAGAVVTVVPNFPDRDVTSVFDVGRVGNSYGAGAGTLFNPPGFEPRDLFGGMFDSYVPERGRLVFLDNQAKGHGRNDQRHSRQPRVAHELRPLDFRGHGFGRRPKFKRIQIVRRRDAP